ncbi:MAG: hypothetical protein ACI9GZ_001402 [Bacteroidia bacterium]|jgi:hypothetical protein
METQKKIMLAFFAIVYLISTDLHAKDDKVYSTAPEGAIVLFDGTDFSQWVNCDGGEVRWKIIDGIMEVVGDSTWACPKIQGTMTKQLFKDFQLHVEFKLPDTKNTNSGIYIQKRYELQINSNINTEPQPGMGGSIYRQKVPDAIVGKQKGVWETYDILFRAARFDPDNLTKKSENARISVIHNGVVIHNNVIIKAKTGVGFPEGNELGPIMLQDHLSTVQFRNIWVIPNVPIETLPEDDH